ASLEGMAGMPWMMVSNSRFNLKKAELPSQTETQMFVNPQDPLVTKPELMSFMTATPITKGPTDERVKIVDWSNPTAEPNARGNFIYPENTPQFDQVHTFAIVKKTFDMYQDLLGRKVNWGFPNSKQLSVFPHAGYMMNAYYSRKDRAIKLFEFMRPDTGKIVKTCQSSDIVSHETGHATLDGIKPLLMENFGFGVAGFHEAFADTTAMLLAMQHDSILNTMLNMTKGDLKKENIVACLAEEFGDAIHKNDNDPKTDNMQYLRNAINFFKAKPYREMPYYDRLNNDTVLGLESHSYSRLYLGAAYDILVGMYEKAKKADTFDDQKMALMEARDTFAKTFARALDFSPAGELDFKDMALSMIKADIIDNKGANREILEKVFKDREILKDKDIEYFNQELGRLPQLELPSTINTTAEVLQFVNENKTKFHVPEDVDLKPYEAYINSKGEKHIVLTYDNYVLLQGEQFGRYQGQAVNVAGSVHLAFDQDGKLIANTVKKITPTVKEDVLYAIELMIKHMMAQQKKDEPKKPDEEKKPDESKKPDGENKTDDSKKPDETKKPDGGLTPMMYEELETLAMPELYSKKSEFGNFTELAKAPAISDPVDPTKRGAKALGNYFKKLQEQLQVN
ncbi:MAG: hypothetical protein AB1782_13310, partial [Cyanobacteriota bacterium]